jgi:anion-transporting  ArsA/GET3 family ATPase
MRRLLINNVIPAEAAPACGFCTARRDAQLKVIGAFRRSLDGISLFVAPQQKHEVRGRKRLSEHLASCYLLPRGSSRGPAAVSSKQRGD